MLDGLAAQTRQPDAVFVVDNASTDHTPRGARGRGARDLPLQRHPQRRRTSAAPAASTSACETAYDAGYDRIWLMDDDVVPGARTASSVLLGPRRGRA